MEPAPGQARPTRSGTGGLFSRLKSARAGRSAAAGDDAFPFPRQSSDSTLHPAGRPASLPSARSSMDSCANDAPMSDPYYSQRQSLEDNNAVGWPVPDAAPYHADADSAVAAHYAAATMAAQSQPAHAAAGLQAPAGVAGHLGTFCHSLPPAASPGGSSSGSGVDPDRRAAGPLASSSARLLQAGADRGVRRPSSGRHPANLEHGSTAPPGAIDELAEILLAATARQERPAETCTSGAATAAGAQAWDGDSGGGGGSGHGDAARLNAGRHSAPPAHSGGEPLLSSQVALLAQQLLMQQQAAAAAGTSAAARLRHSFQLGAEQRQPQPQYPPRPHSLDRCRTMPMSGLPQPARAGPGQLSAAEMLLLGSASERPAGMLPPAGPTWPPQAAARRGVGAVMGLAALDAIAQPRASPPGPEELSPSPFCSVQGVYGCHLLPPTDVSEPPHAAPSPHVGGRSSIDLLLDPRPASSRPSSHRYSLDTLQELLVPAPHEPSAGDAGRPTVAQLMQLFPSGRNSLGSAGPGGGGAPRGGAMVRHSMDEGRRLQGAARTLSTLTSARRSARTRGAEPALFYGHLSAGAMHDLANSTVTVVAGAVPVPAPAAARATTVSAHASSMVDPAARPVAGTFEARVGTPEDSMLDPDLHDTFGAHPSYGLSAAPAHRRSGSGGSGGGSARGSAASTPTANGWRMPTGAARRLQPPAHRRSADARCPVTPAPACAGHQPAVYQPHELQPAAAAPEGSPGGGSVLLDPTSVPGQHSITVNDPQAIVPSLRLLKQRALARQKLERLDSGDGKHGGAGGDGAASAGYIAEAKRVLAAAVHTASAQEAAVVESSCSGAIGPLLRYLRDNKHNDAAMRAGLHTLSLLVTNSPNRGIIVSFHGQAMLCEAMRATSDLELRENIVQLLWDLEAHNRECRFEPDDIQALLSVLEASSNALVASHILHLLHHCLARADPPDMQPQQMQLCAERLVSEIAAHKHHLQDAAQYALGNLVAVVLGDARVTAPQRQAMTARLLDELRRTTTPGQCQVVLTVLSCIAGNARVRSAMAHCNARRRLVDFGQRVSDPRLRARSLSLVKILHKQEALESQAVGSWYFGGGGDSAHASLGSSPSG